MGRLKWVSIVFACAAVSLAVGAGAFSSVSADRGVEVSVVEDDKAMLGIEAVDGDEIRSDNPPQKQKAIKFHNQFGEKLDLSVDITEGVPGKKPELVNYNLEDRTVNSGKDVMLYAVINCKSGNPPPSEPWTVDVSATGDTVSVQTTTEVTVQCTGNGNGGGSSTGTESSNGTGPPDTHPGQSKGE